MTYAHIGIDPGKSGGFGIIYPDGKAACYKQPETEKDIWELLCELRLCEWPVRAVLEKVHSMPGQGVSSTFAFGCNYGALRMALIASGIPFVDVTPQKWQKELGVVPRDNKGGESKVEFKNRLKGKAQQMFPELKINLHTADALLLAEWLRRQP